MALLFKQPDIVLGMIFLACLGLILTALGYQHLAGLEPCDLCYKQRWAYYIAIGAVPIALFLYGRETKNPDGLFSAKTAKLMSVLIMGALALVFLANSGLGIYHAGVEWDFWPGPTACSSTGDLDPSLSIFEAIKREKIVPCGEAQWRLFGLSMAGYSALASLGLSLLAGFFSFMVAKR